MTIAEMDAKIQEYCNDCDVCILKELCERVHGDFQISEKVCKEAYDMISKQNDPVNPNHYKQGGVECIEALKSATVGKKGIEAVCTANVIKYLWRYEEKNGLEDIHKAQWYLNRLEKEVSKNE